MNLDFKEKVYNEVCNQLNAKVEGLSAALNDINASKNDETKSTAGDKHEVGRAMAQIEQDKISKQLLQANKQTVLLNSLNLEELDEAQLGALVETNTSIFYLSISLGCVSVEGKSIFVISMMSPIGKQLLGKKEGETLVFNGNKLSISGIC